MLSSRLLSPAEKMTQLCTQEKLKGSLQLVPGNEIPYVGWLLNTFKHSESYRTPLTLTANNFSPQWRPLEYRGWVSRRINPNSPPLPWSSVYMHVFGALVKLRSGAPSHPCLHLSCAPCCLPSPLPTFHCIHTTGTHAPPSSGLTLGMNQELWATLAALTGATMRITAPAC